MKRSTASLGAAAAPPSDTYAVKLEIDRSYDERHTRANSGVGGQPSLIDECGIAAGQGPSEGVFEPIGTGSVDGSDGSIRPGLEGIGTAPKLLDGATTSYDEGAAK
ncbi:MAG: hypothetical protein M0Z80_14855 [Treponema sp.]|nr:hypothetical protein [Treponema sp.]